MLHVPIAATFFEQALRSGYKTGYLLEILTGLPMDAHLVGASFNEEKGQVDLYFSQPRIPDTDITDLTITVKSIRAEPIPETAG